MKMNTNEKVLNSTVWKNVCFKIGKIFIFAIITFYFVVSLLFFMAPKIDAKIFNFFGLKKAEESCYVRIFEQSGDEIDLYNLIVFEARQGDSSKQLQYINMMLASDDYNEFVVNFNSSSLANLINSNGELEDKKLVPYVCNINSYLLNQKVSCMIDLNFNKSNIENFICVNLESDNLFEFTISTYLNHIVANNSLSQTEKREIVDSLLSATNGTKTVDTLLSERIQKLNEFLAGENLSVVSDILGKNILMNMRLAEYRIAEIKGEDLTTVKSNYEVAVNGYNECVK